MPIFHRTFRYTFNINKTWTYNTAGNLLRKASRFPNFAIGCDNSVGSAANLNPTINLFNWQVQWKNIY